MSVDCIAEKSAVERFSDLAFGIALADFPPRDPAKKSELNEVFWNRILNLPGPRSVKGEKTIESHFMGVLLQGHLEIQLTFHTVLRAREYFKRVPRGLTTRKSDYLAFIIHAYLNELYILEERLISYPKVLERAAAKGSDLRMALRKVKPTIGQSVKLAFKKVREIRGDAVHKSRFSDEAIERLSTIELFLNSADFVVPFKPLYRSELVRVRKLWDEGFVANEKSVKAIMESYYVLMLASTFVQDGTFRRFS